MTSNLRVSPDQPISAALDDLYGEARKHAEAAMSDNTRRAYDGDWKNFDTWCAGHNLSSMPASGETVALYVTDQAKTLKMSTVQRRLSTISMAHQHQGHPSPIGAIEVKRVMQGLRRKLGTAPTKKKPLRVSDLRRLADCLDLDRPAGLRDHALLLIGFVGALRRSELVALQVDDLEDHEHGMVITIKRSKTDQTGQSRRIGIPYGSNPTTCPVRATRRWIAAAELTDGPLWRPINRHGHISDKQLTPQSVALIVKRTVACAGLDPNQFAGHSLRSGFATAAADAGIAERAIMRQTGHRSLPVLRGYIEEGTLFTNNAATQIGL